MSKLKTYTPFFRGYVGTPADGAWYVDGKLREDHPDIPMPYHDDWVKGRVSCVLDPITLLKYFPCEIADKHKITYGLFVTQAPLEPIVDSVGTYYRTDITKAIKVCEFNRLELYSLVINILFDRLEKNGENND
jgi:hypothetical protein